MRVLHVHNFYQLPGGEDQCFASTGAMLKDHGHEVVPFTLDNDAVATMGKVATATTAVWHGATYRELRRLIRTTRPDVAHSRTPSRWCRRRRTTPVTPKVCRCSRCSTTFASCAPGDPLSRR